MKKIFYLLLVFLSFNYLIFASVADYQQAKVALKNQDYNKALNSLNNYLSKDNRLKDFALYYKGFSLQMLKQEKKALTTYQELINQYPSFPLNNRARAFINNYNAKNRTFNINTASGLWQRAMFYYNAKNWQRAEADFRDYLKRFPQSSADSNAEYHLALSLLNQNKYGQANSYFDKVIKNKSSKSMAARKQKVLLLEKQKKYDLAEAGWKHLSALYAGTEFGFEAFENLAKLQHATDKLKASIETCKQFVARYPNNWRARKFYERMGRIYYLLDDFANANLALQGAIKYRNPDALARGEVFHLLAETYRLIGNTAKEQEIKRNLVSNTPYLYYAFVARQELNINNLVMPKNNMNLDKKDFFKNNIPRVDLLISVGAYDDAALLTEQYRQANPQDNMSISHFIIWLYEEASDYAAAQRRAENIWNYYGNNAILGQLPLYFWQKSYPIYYKDAIWQLSKEHNIDPFLVLALIREESRFKEGVSSWAGAVGLMQLMPYTAAAEAKKHNIKEGDLKDAQYNLKIGILHLAYLLEAYKGNFTYALAAYNGGINATNRWVQKYPNLNQTDFTERIGYYETRRYVKKVLQSYWIYKWLYT